MQRELIAKNESQPIEEAIICLFIYLFIYFKVVQSQVSARMTSCCKLKQQEVVPLFYVCFQNLLDL